MKAKFSLKILFQFDNSDPGLALSISAQTERFYRFVMTQHILNGSAESAGPLSVDNRHRFQLSHHGTVKIALRRQHRFDRLTDELTERIINDAKARYDTLLKLSEIDIV